MNGKMTDKKRNLIAISAFLSTVSIAWVFEESIWLFLITFILGYIAGFARYPIADREYGNPIKEGLED